MSDKKMSLKNYTGSQSTRQRIRRRLRKVGEESLLPESVVVGLQRLLGLLQRFQIVRRRKMRSSVMDRRRLAGLFGRIRRNDQSVESGSSNDAASSAG